MKRAHSQAHIKHICFYVRAIASLASLLLFSIIGKETPAKAKVDRWQASILATILGSRGDKLEEMDEKGNRRQSMPLMKARYRWPERMFSPAIKINEDGSFEAEYKLPDNAPSGAYTVIAVVDKDIKSAPVTFKHDLPFGKLYFSRAGQSLNILGPFFPCCSSMHIRRYDGCWWRFYS